MYEFLYVYIKPEYRKIANLYCMDADRFIAKIKTGDVYKDNANDVEKRYIKTMTHQTMKLKNPYQQVKTKKRLD